MPAAPVGHEPGSSTTHRREDGRGGPGSVLRATSASLDQLAASLPEPVVSISLRAWPLRLPGRIAVKRRPPYESRADSVMYCQVLAECADLRGWDVHLFTRRTSRRRRPGSSVSKQRRAPCSSRQRWDPPWTKDHRIALAATIVRELIPPSGPPVGVEQADGTAIRPAVRSSIIR